MAVDPDVLTITDELAARLAAVESRSDVVDLKADFGAVGDSVTVDTARIQDAIDAAIVDELELYVPRGVYLTDPGLVWDAGLVRIRGHGSQSSVFKFTSIEDDGLTFGQAGFHGHLGTQGWVSNIGVQGPTNMAPTTPNYKSAVVFSNLRFADVSNLYVRGFDIGYDMRDNCFGTSFSNVHARYAKCNIGFRLQGHQETGNDHNFLNCWLSGNKAAINVAGQLSSGYTFLGGQMASGNDLTAPDDDAACLRLGRTYEETPSDWQSGRINFYGTNFHDAIHAWQVRAYAPTPGVDFNGVTFRANGHSPALGLFKNSKPWHDRVTWTNSNVFGVYSTALIDLAPGNGDTFYFEQGTIGRPKVNGQVVDLFKEGFLSRAGIV